MEKLEEFQEDTGQEPSGNYVTNKIFVESVRALISFLDLSSCYCRRVSLDWWNGGRTVGKVRAPVWWLLQERGQQTWETWAHRQRAEFCLYCHTGKGQPERNPQIPWLRLGTTWTQLITSYILQVQNKLEQIFKKYIRRQDTKSGAGKPAKPWKIGERVAMKYGNLFLGCIPQYHTWHYARFLILEFFVAAKKPQSNPDNVGSANPPTQDVKFSNEDSCDAAGASTSNSDGK